jgi:long-chain fatty acid transport protein
VESVKRIVSALAIATTLVASEAHAAGLYFSERGVRPMGRAGAYVAGADDLGAIWYNPAGLADAKTSLLADFSWLRFTSEYTRTLRIVDADNTVRYVSNDPVNGSSPVIPLPTLAASYAFGEKKEFTIAAAAYAPYAAIVTYPDTVNNRPSPARYALGSFEGSALIFTGMYFAWKPLEQLRLGIGLDALVGQYQSTVTYSVSPPDRLVGAPEQPEYDAKTSFKAGPIFAPSASLGVTWVPINEIRLGTAFQLPRVVSAPASFDVRLPSGAIFDNAHIDGNTAHVRFKLPAIFRAGIEGRPTEDVRVEFAYEREFWSIHDAIEITPDNVSFGGIAGLPNRIPIPAIRYPRNFQDSNSFRLGAEYSFKMFGYPYDIRAGLSYETSAVPPAYLSLLTIDMDKTTLSIGGSVHVADHWRFDFVYAHLFASSVNVSADDAKIPRVNPIPGNVNLETVNGGRYSVNADLIGVGAQYTF